MELELGQELLLLPASFLSTLLALPVNFPPSDEKHALA